MKSIYMTKLLIASSLIFSPTVLMAAEPNKMDRGF